MKLGNFSMSLNVKDIKASKEFYEKIGFEQMGGNIEENWVIMKNGDTNIGLFQGMFEKNSMTFNPGWNSNAENLDEFDDIREIQKKFKEAGIELKTEAEDGEGPAHFSLIDPDGNPILFDQHR